MKHTRNSIGQYTIGAVPSNKIVLPKEELIELYKTYGAFMISKRYGVSKQTVLRNLHEYNIPIKNSGSPKKLPDYWKNNLRKPKSKPAWSKGLNKENDSHLKHISESLKGPKNKSWKPEIHTNKMIKCKCGCGQLRPIYDSKGRKRYYIKGHYNKYQFKKGDPAWNKNKKWDRETIMKILVRRSPNNPEQYLTKFFINNNFPYKFVGDGQIIIGGRNPDFIDTTNRHKIIEFFGEHWHKPEDENIKRKIYKEHGYSLLVIWGNDLKDETKLYNTILKYDI